MSAPFDIAELRANIGDDREIERMLLATFVESCRESLAWLSSHLDAAESDAWKSQMHQIKGAALNIGAQGLAEAAMAGQAGYLDPEPAKKPLLDAVAQRFGEVERFIRERNLT